VSGDFQTRQVVIVHENMWNALVILGSTCDLELVRIPNGTDNQGQPVLDNPDDLPTYAFMPVT
jgi:hypothetical protein